MNDMDTLADAVNAVSEKTVREVDTGLIGEEKVVVTPAKADTAKAPVAVKYGAAVGSAVAMIKQYSENMNKGARVTHATIDAEQAKLYLAISSIVKVDDTEEFMKGMEFLFLTFRNDEGAFSGDRIRRRVSFMKQPSSDKAMSAYMAFLDLLHIFSDPKGRKVLWPRFNKTLAFSFCPPGQKRQRLENYMKKITA